MSDVATFPFDTATGLDDDEVAAGPDRRKLLLLITAGVVVAALLGYFLAVSLFGGEEVIAATSPVRAAPLASAPAALPPTPAPPVLAGSRNPFLPLVFPPAAAAATTPVTQPVVAPVAPAPVATAPATSGTTPGMTTFKLLSVAGSQAVVTIDTVRYTVSVGQVFAGTYRLTATSGGACADFLNGAKKMSLCEGQTLLF